MPGSSSPPADLLRQLSDQLTHDRWFDIGFPGARDINFAELADLLTGHLLNNVGDPWEAGHGRSHTKALERQVVDIIGDWLRAPEGRWGYVTGGSSEGTLHALDEAWQRFCGEELVVFASSAAHYSVAKAARMLKLQMVMIAADDTGKMDMHDLEEELRRRRHQPAMIVATAGTTMSEAVDDVAAIAKVCDRLAISRRRIHVDAALAGLPLSLLPEADRPAFDFTAGATSMVVSGHKFLSTLTPCGVLVYADSPYTVAGRRIVYTGSADTTVTGSRSGHTTLRLWWALTTIDADGHRRRAEYARDLAQYTHQRLQGIGWPSGHNPHAFTVVLRSPPAKLRGNWVLADDGMSAHVVCLPGMQREQIDAFIDDLTGAGEGHADQPNTTSKASSLRLASLARRR